jgi:hypothetical protein
MSRQTGSCVRALKLTAFLSTLVGAILLQAVEPATAALKHVIIIESVDVGFPALIHEETPEHMEIAPAISVEKEPAAAR